MKDEILQEAFSLPMTLKTCTQKASCRIWTVYQACPWCWYLVYAVLTLTVIVSYTLQTRSVHCPTPTQAVRPLLPMSWLAPKTIKRLTYFNVDLSLQTLKVNWQTSSYLLWCSLLLVYNKLCACCSCNSCPLIFLVAFSTRYCNGTTSYVVAKEDTVNTLNLVSS